MKHNRFRPPLIDALLFHSLEPSNPFVLGFYASYELQKEGNRTRSFRLTGIAGQTWSPSQHTSDLRKDISCQAELQCL